MKKPIALVALAILSFVGTGYAKEQEAPFLQLDAVDLATILPPPPPQDSDTTRAEIAEIHRAQASATPADKAQAEADSKEEVFLFSTVLGPNFSADKLPLATNFFAEVGETEGEFVDPAKKIIGRPRPPLADPTIVPCEKLKASASYPSGHATFAILQAVVLMQMIPEKRDAIFPRAAEFGHNRVICGVHYPSDVEAGKISGMVIGALLLANTTFRSEFGPAKAEVRKALALPPQ